jgi:hypothetical protein
MQNSKLIIEPTGEFSYQAVNQSGNIVYSFAYFPEQGESGYALHRWISFLPDEEIINLYEYSLDFFNRHHIVPALSVSDITTYDGSFDGINEYMITSLLPRVLAMGFRAGATVLPTDFFAQLALDEYREMAKNLPYKQEYFESLAEASAWIIEQ